MSCMTQPKPRRSALITGGTSGIGLAVARALLDDGYGVTICSRSTERVANAQADLVAHGQVHPVVADVSLSHDVDHLLTEHTDRFGRLDVLVNNAGSATIGTVTTAPVDQLDESIASHVRSNWLVTAAASPLLRKAGEEHGRAVVVTISSVLGRYGQSITAAYSTAKAALFALSQAVHDELAAHGVRATVIAPAYVATPMTEPLTHLDRDGMILPDDIAEAVRFLTRLSPTAAVPEIQVLRSTDRLLTA